LSKDELDTTVEYIPDEYDGDDEPTVTTSQVSKDTVFVCPKCGIRNHLKDSSCIKCDRAWI